MQASFDPRPSASADPADPPWRLSMRARDPHEAHRVATPLELLFDLTFVVAIAALVPELAHSIVDGHPLEGVAGFIAVFFAIWWAWMNFTWFASAYDGDDWLYRLLTMVQMAGVLVLAAGVAPAFETGDFSTVVVGYVIMRTALVFQWLRAAASDPVHRAATLRYATGVAAIQVLWVVRLALPAPIAGATFLVLGIAELLVPVWAERPNMTTWHPHHIAERYGLFTIIVLGESVLAATTAVIAARTETGLTGPLVVLAASALVLLFSLWWIYFLEPAAPHLEARRDRSFLWGYGHFFVFSSLAAVGAGLEVIAESLVHEVDASPLLVGYSLALPVAVYLLALWMLHIGMGASDRVRPLLMIGAVVVILLVPLATATLSGVGVAAVVAATTSGIVIWKTVRPTPAARAVTAPEA